MLFLFWDRGRRVPLSCTNLGPTLDPTEGTVAYLGVLVPGVPFLLWAWFFSPSVGTYSWGRLGSEVVLLVLR